MTAAAATGAVLGLVLGLGLVLIALSTPWLRRTDVAARVDPYLRKGAVSSLLDSSPTRGRWRRLLVLAAGPVADSALGILERLTGGQAELERRLRLAGRRSTTESFRVEQVVLGAIGGVIGLLLGVVAVVSRGASPLVGILLVGIGIVTGVIARDWMLGRQVRSRARRMAREFPMVADLLALAVAAGEGPVPAMERVARTSHGALPEEFAATVAAIRAGATVEQALLDLGERTPLDALGRFGEGVAVAIERGTPLSDVLRARAQDAREASKRELMEIAGQREIIMMIPVVFFIMPLVIVFALFPGLAVLDINL